MPLQPRSIKTTDGKQEYPIDFVRNYFINSDESIEEVALQLNLPVALVQVHARQGLESWYKLKSDKLEARMRYFLSLNIDNLMETHSLLEDGHFLTLAQYKGVQEFLKQYLVKHGHLFAVDEQDVIRKDSYGMPIPLPLPNHPKHFMALEGFLKLKEGTKLAMNDLYEESKKQKKQSDVIDVESDEIFQESDD